MQTYTIYKTSNPKILHKITTERVNATAQKDLLNFLMPNLTEASFLREFKREE